MRIGIVNSAVRNWDATSYFRGFGCLSRCDDLRVYQLPEALSWQLIVNLDAILFTNPVTEKLFHAIHYCKAWGIPIWIDYDDDHFHVPEDNQHYEAYMNPTAQEMIKRIMATADLMTVSTDALKNQCVEYTDNIHVVNNGWDLKRLPIDGRLNTTKFIQWRGGQNRINDLETIREQIINLAEKHKDWTFQFYGRAIMFRNKSDNIKTHPGIAFQNCGLQQFKQNRPSVQIVPLEGIVYNCCKSNIAWLEATYNGSVCIAKEIGEYKNIPVFGYRTDDQFTELIEYVMSTESYQDRLQLFKQSIELIKSRYNIIETNKKRIELLEGIL